MTRRLLRKLKSDSTTESTENTEKKSELANLRFSVSSVCSVVNKGIEMSYKGFDITSKVCLITGGTSGIGRAIALAMASAGARVMAGSTNPEKVSAIRNELGEAHDAVQLDVADDASVKNAVERTVSRFGRPGKQPGHRIGQAGPGEQRAIALKRQSQPNHRHD